MVLKGFVYAIVVDVYTFCLAFSGILPCVLHHFALHLAPKRTASSTKTHCVLRHIARHLAAYCTIFCCKSPEIWCKWRFLEINIHFIVFTNYPLFVSKQTFARIDFLRQGGRLVGKMAAIMLNFVLKTLHECDRCSVVAVHFFSFVVGFLCGVSFICRALGWLFLIV